MRRERPSPGELKGHPQRRETEGPAPTPGARCPPGVFLGFNAAMGFLGESPAARALRELIGQVAPIDVTLLLTGESGSGKGVVARAVHAASRRRSGPFITVSCPVLPRDLLESELFGHEKGSFTGALRAHAGAIERAAGGTLFLDEVGDLPLGLQPKLLSVLQDREYRRVGGMQTLRADVRIIAATHFDLRASVQARTFREDLFYRLNVVPIRVPALRERLEDVTVLCRHILAGIADRRGCNIALLSSSALDLLLAHDWPGNVRELENVLERATLLAGDRELRPADLPEEIRHPGARAPARAAAALPLDPGVEPLTLRAMERLVIERTLADCGGNRAAAARRLGISEKTIRNKLRRHGLGITSPASPP